MRMLSQALLAAIYFVVFTASPARAQTAETSPGTPSAVAAPKGPSERQKAIMTIDAVINSKTYDLPPEKAERKFLKNVDKGIQKVEEENRRAIEELPENEQIAMLGSTIAYAQESGQKELEEKLYQIRDDEDLSLSEKLSKIKNDQYRGQVTKLARESVRSAGSVQQMLVETRERYQIEENQSHMWSDEWKAKFSEINVKDLIIDSVITVAVIGILIGGGAPILGALAAVGSVILGSLAAALLCAVFQKGKYFKNVDRAFHINLRISMSFLGLAALAGIIWGGGLAAAGGNGINGYVVGEKSLSWASKGSLTLGNASFINGKQQLSILPHEQGHSVQFIFLSLVFGTFGPYAVWGSYLTMGVLGNFKVGKFWEENAGMLGGYNKPVNWLH